MENDRCDNLKARAKTVYRRYGTLLELPKAYPFAFWTETAQQTWREINAMPVEERTRLEADVKEAIRRDTQSEDPRQSDSRSRSDQERRTGRRRPGRYDLKSCTTGLDALALAGGFTEFASRRRIVLLRPEPASSKRIPFAIWEVPTRGQQNLCLHRGDILLVP